MTRFADGERFPAPARQSNRGTAPRAAYLDGWRGLAIIMVLVAHFGGAYVGRLYVLGGFGVDLFFVLSGRLMASILFVSRHPLPDFFRRRFARIFPALAVFTAAMALFSLIFFALHGVPVIEPWEFLAAVTFTMNYVPAATGGSSLALGHIWSLSVEEHCYVALALIAFLLSRRIGPAKWVLTLAGIAGLLNGARLWAIGAGGAHAIYWRTDVRLAPTFLSAALFLWLRDADLREGKLTRALGWLPVPCTVLTAALFFVAPFPLAYTASALLLAVSVNMLDLSPAWLLRLLSTRVLTAFGLLSYSIYLWQQPAYMLSDKVSALVLIPAAVALGAASFFLVERPAQRWINGRGTGGSASGRTRRPARPLTTAAGRGSYDPPRHRRAGSPGASVRGA